MISTWGDTDHNDGTKGTQPRFTRITNNFAHEMGLFEKQSSFYFQAKACQTFLDGNIAFNGPRAMINFNDGFGGGNTVSNSLIFNTCRESGDHGPINSWDRLPFITKVAYGYPSYDAAPTNTTKNFIMANYGGSQAFDNDDGSSWYHTFENFFYSADGFKMDYACFNVASFLPGHGDKLYKNKCIVAD